MFMKKSTQKPEYDKPMTIIGQDTVLEGAVLKSSKAVQINGKFIGDIQIDSSVSIGETGLIQGNIKANYLLVAGKIQGDCELSSQIHLTSTAVIKGNIICGSIIIDEGAQVNGTCSMISSASQQSNKQEKKENSKA